MFDILDNLFGRKIPELGRDTSYMEPTKYPETLEDIVGSPTIHGDTWLLLSWLLLAIQCIAREVIKLKIKAQVPSTSDAVMFKSSDSSPK